MIYLLDGSILNKNSLKEDEIIGKLPCIGILNKSEIKNWETHLGINERILSECLTGQVSKFESHDCFDFIALHIPDKTDLLKKESRISIYFKKNILLFICEEAFEFSILSGIISKIQMKEINILTLERVLYEFFDQLTISDSFYLETIEQDISDLEESLITSKKRDYIKEIITFRKNLLALKSYYDQLQEFAYALKDNENQLISEDMVRYFKMLSDRTKRLTNSVLNLKDYVSQVREAYQSQVDIDQNSIMKLFTVITAIFLPLTLIVGWYGMNFSMPEYKWTYGYSLIIIVCVLVSLFSIIYFKKCKWF
ncbi:magnesium transporter CorA family protein [Anaerovorax odorimutans]|uniref:magnesium transporter CorA family protein n=1 Tax=Anaerovorax odorimutans TaxID=109327 RepID=UPI0004213CCD|nr:CorA family divalent cation transporter [Anaerovorax odorimutans]